MYARRIAEVLYAGSGPKCPGPQGCIPSQFRGDGLVLYPPIKGRIRKTGGTDSKSPLYQNRAGTVAFYGRTYGNSETVFSTPCVPRPIRPGRSTDWKGQTIRRLRNLRTFPSKNLKNVLQSGVDAPTVSRQ